MSKKLLLVFVLIALTTGALAADFTARILNCPKEVPLGAPLIIRGQVCNISGHPITVAKGYQGFEVSFVVKRADGRPIKGCPRVYMKPSGRYSIETIPEDWVQEKMDSICYGNSPGEFVIQMLVSSTDLFKKHCPRDSAAWIGEIRSEEIRVTVIEPVGIDAQAYKEFDGRPASGLSSLMEELLLPEGANLRRSREAARALLEKYSGSTYAAYALFQRDMNLLPNQDSLRPERLDLTRKIAKWVIDPSGEKPSELIGCRNTERERQRKEVMNATLSQHPEFPFLYAFEYWTALEYCTKRDAKKARPLLEKCLSPDLPKPIRVVAKVYLDVLDENKL